MNNTYTNVHMIYVCVHIHACMYMLSWQVPEWFRSWYQSGRACWIYYWRGSEWDQKSRDHIHDQEHGGDVRVFVRVWSSLSVFWVASSLQRRPSILGLVELQAPLKTSPFSSFKTERNCWEKDGKKKKERRGP